MQVEKVTFEVDIFTCRENTGVKNGCILLFKRAKEVNSMTSPLCSFVYALWFYASADGIITVWNSFG